MLARCVSSENDGGCITLRENRRARTGAVRAGNYVVYYKYVLIRSPPLHNSQEQTSNPDNAKAKEYAAILLSVDPQNEAANAVMQLK